MYCEMTFKQVRLEGHTSNINPYIQMPPQPKDLYIINSDK